MPSSPSSLSSSSASLSSSCGLHLPASYILTTESAVPSFGSTSVTQHLISVPASQFKCKTFLSTSMVAISEKSFAAPSTVLNELRSGCFVFRELVTIDSSFGRRTNTNPTSQLFVQFNEHPSRLEIDRNSLSLLKSQTSLFNTIESPRG